MRVIDLVGPKGYVHGWKFEGVPGAKPAAPKASGSLLDAYKGWRDSLTPAESKAMSFYQSPGFALMNGQLRGADAGQLKASEHASDADLARARQASKGLTKAIAKAPPLPRDTTVYRGFDAGQFGDLTPGKVITDKGFTSVSVNNDAGAVGRATSPAQAVITLPAGTRAAAGSVRELVLPPGSAFRVVSAQKRGGVTHVRLELVPRGSGRKLANRRGRVIDLVGPKGYIHGWIFVGAPGVGAQVFHPSLGAGTVTGTDGGHATVRFDKGGVSKAFPVRTAGPALAPDSGKQFFHGTTRVLKPGDTITSGRDQNFGIPGKSTSTYFADTETQARKYAKYVAKEQGAPAHHVYRVAPTGGYRRAGGSVQGGRWVESDYASEHPLTVLGEVPEAGKASEPARLAPRGGGATGGPAPRQHGMRHTISAEEHDAGKSNAVSMKQQQAIAQAQRIKLHESTGLRSDILDPQSGSRGADLRGMDQGVRAQAKQALAAGDFAKVDSLLGSEIDRLGGGDHWLSRPAADRRTAGGLSAIQATIAQAARKSKPTPPPLVRTGANADGSMNVIDHQGNTYKVALKAGNVTVSSDHGINTASAGGSATDTARRLAGQLAGRQDRAQAAAKADLGTSAGRAQVAKIQRESERASAGPSKAEMVRNAAIMRGTAGAAKPTPAARKLAKAEATQRDAEAAYQTANDAYQAALAAERTPGGGTDIHSPAAQRTESLRQPMLDAKSARSKARLTVLGLRHAAVTSSTEGDHAGVHYRATTSSGQPSYELTYKGTTGQTLARGRTPQEAAAEFKTSQDKATATGIRTDAERARAQDQIGKQDIARTRALAAEPLGLGEVVAAYQAAHGGKNPPKSALIRWARSGVPASTRSAAWYKAAAGAKTGKSLARPRGHTLELAGPKGWSHGWIRDGDTVTYPGNLGVDRADMAQLSGTVAGQYVPSSVMVPKFIAHLQGKGIPVTRKRVPARSLRATQTTGSMPVIRSIADDLRSGKLADTKPIVVSSDNRVLDGHHNWAGRVLADSEGGRPGLPAGMPVVQVGMPMADLIGEAREFGRASGVAQRGPGEIGNPAFMKPAKVGLARRGGRGVELAGGRVKTPGPQRAAGRRKLAAKKQALPGGSFPIPDVDYLKRAIRSVGRAPASKRPALAALIRKRATQLKATKTPGVKGTWAFQAANTHGKVIDMATATMTRKMPVVRGAADVQLSRSGPGKVTVMHKSSGAKIGTLAQSGKGWQGTHASGAKCPPSGSMGGAVAGLVAAHNQLARGKKLPPAQQDGTASYAHEAGDGISLAGSLPVTSASDGPRVTAMGGGTGKAGLSGEAAAVYAKLIKKGLKPGQALAMAKRAAAMKARKTGPKASAA